MSKKRHYSPFTVIIIFVCFTLVGLAIVPLLPIKLSPSRSFKSLTVSYSLSDYSSRVIELEITCKLEAMLARIKGIEAISSNSNNGWGTITLRFDKHADMSLTRFEVSTIIRQIWSELPQGTSYPQVSARRVSKSSEKSFMIYRINAATTPILIQRYAEEHFKVVLAQLKGVYKVHISGATPMEWQLEYDTEQLRRLGTNIEDIKAAIRGHYQKEFLGMAALEKSDGTKEWLRLKSFSTENEMNFNPKEIFLTTASGDMLVLDKLVRVNHVEKTPTSYFRINGLNSIVLAINADEMANQLELSQQVKELMGELQQTMPKGYQVFLDYDASKYINDKLDKIYFRTALTILILLLFVLLITRSFRYLFLIITSLIANIAIAVIFYYLLDLEIQLYSLAGITISLNLVIDNTIVMSDHLLRKRNLKVFISVLAATLTTIGALSVIFFLDEEMRLNLQDFAAVVIINLAVSLLIALFFVPAMINKIGLDKQRIYKQHPQLSLKRRTVAFTHLYKRFILFICRYRVLACLLLLLTFGLPVFMLPSRVNEDNRLGKIYNSIFDTSTFKEKVKPILDKTLGGTLRLFVDEVYEGSYFNRGTEEMSLRINKTLPNGATLQQMNALIQQLEVYLSQYKGIRFFRTYIRSAQNGSIDLFFTKEAEKTDFPYKLKSELYRKVQELGGGSWTILGLKSYLPVNSGQEYNGQIRIKMWGYNYDELNGWAEALRLRLLKNRRIKEVTIHPEYEALKIDYSEFYLQFDREKMAKEGLTFRLFFRTLYSTFGKDIFCGNVFYEGEMEALKLFSLQGKTFDIWALKNMPFAIGEKQYKLMNFATLEKRQASQRVFREEQQYRLCLQFNYIGYMGQAYSFVENDLKEFRKQLPLGYIVKNERQTFTWGSDSWKQYALLLVIAVVIFFITSILFNSLKQPFVILFIIPISYIGVFLTFYLFDLNFDYGGLASFVLLCGITVNASIYIINEYNAIRKRQVNLLPIDAYTKAWNTKIIPIFLTVISTILGFIPFMVGDVKEGFWFPLAAGTIGGLLMSVLGIFLFLPIFMLKKEGKRK